MHAICIIHLNQIGDLVFSLPLIRALREAYPRVEIHSVIKPYLVELLECVPDVDRILPRPTDMRGRLALVRQMRLSRYDLLLSLAHSEEALMMAALSGARTKAGFRHAPWDLCLDVRERIEGHNGWYNNARLLKRLGIACAKDDYVGLLPVERGHSGVELPEHFAVYSPGASSRRQTKTWEDEKFAGLMSRVWRSYGLAPVLVGGSDTRATASRIIEHLAACDPQAARAATELSGRLGLRALCSLLRDARLFAGIDSGVMHLAACMDVPLVALFGPSDPRYVGPHNRRSIVVREDSLACVPCYLKPCAERTCMKQLEIDTAFAACGKLLGRPAAEDAVPPEHVRDR